MEIDEAVGEFSVPIFRKSSQRYPSDLTCVWVLTGGKDRGRGLAVTFTQIQLGEDPRATQYSQDKIKVIQSSRYTCIVLVIGQGFPLPKQFQRSRSVLQENLDLWNCFGREKPIS